MRTSTKQPGYYTPKTLGEEAFGFYREQGYLVVEGALTSAEVEKTIAETVRICRGEAGAVKNLPDTNAGENDDEVLQKVLCIHQAHAISPHMRGLLAHEILVSVLTGIIGPNVKCMQSMLFIKAAGKPGQAWHQDEVYIPTRDRSLCGAWIALDDATTTNGCLWVIPGSQKPGVLWPQYPHNDKRFDCAWETFDFPYKDDDAIPVEVGAGGIVFFNGYLLHRSLPNRAAAGYRRCLVNHYMSAESLLPWYLDKLPDGTRVATADRRDIIMVAGNDPYAYKGTEEGGEAVIRPTGDGGCGDGRTSLAEHKAKKRA